MNKARVLSIAKKINWAWVLVVALPVAFVASFSKGSMEHPIFGSFVGLLVAFITAILISFFKSIQEKKNYEEPITRFMAFNGTKYSTHSAFGVGIFFLSLGVVAYFVLRDTEDAFLSLGFVFIAIFPLKYCLLPNQIILGEKSIVLRRSLVSWRSEELFSLDKLEAAEFTAMGALKFRFSDGKSFIVSMYQQYLFARLPIYKGIVKNKNIVGLYNFKQEVERRAQVSSSLSGTEEEKYLAELPFNSTSLLGFLTYASAGLALVAVPALILIFLLGKEAGDRAPNACHPHRPSSLKQ